MSETMSCPPVIAAVFVIVLLFFAHSPGHAATITFANNGEYTVWVTIVADPGGTSSQPSTRSFALQAGDHSHVNDLSPVWWGQIWGQVTSGDCGNSTMECVCEGEFCYDNNSSSSATVAELNLTDTKNGLSYYKVSLDRGYNLPMKVEPVSKRMKCIAAGCTIDLSTECPEELKVTRSGEVVACKSGCQALGDCCSDCEPNLYPKNIKNICPDAYATAYNDATYACPSSNFLITFQHPNCTGLMEPGKATAVHNSSQLLQTIGKVVVGVILALGVGACACRLRCMYSNSRFTTAIQLAVKINATS